MCCWKISWAFDNLIDLQKGFHPQGSCQPTSMPWIISYNIGFLFIRSILENIFQFGKQKLKILPHKIHFHFDELMHFPIRLLIQKILAGRQWGRKHLKVQHNYEKHDSRDCGRPASCGIQLDVWKLIVNNHNWLSKQLYKVQSSSIK